MDSILTDQNDDVSAFSPPTMQIAGSFGHTIDFLSQPYLRNRFTDCDIEDHPCNLDKLRPLPIFLKFEDVEYRVRDSQRNQAHILRGITGSVRPGEILALMGPSGSGKTTLLKILAGRASEEVAGRISYNDVAYHTGLRRRIGFVSQEDVLFPQLTVEETLRFAAFLRLPRHMSSRQKHLKVETIIADLGLERCRHTRTGGGFVKGISGGERKRTSIGYEILVDPSLLLLDEPTSGLDSTSANKILLVLQGLAKAGRTIVTTIHQPSGRVFHMFDKLLLISGGIPVYYGKARDSMSYFASLRFTPQLPMNPAEFLLDLATGEVSGIDVPDELSTGSEKGAINYLHRIYKTNQEPIEKAENHRDARAPEHLQLAIRVKKEWTLQWWEQFAILFKRTYRERCRDYFDLLRLIQTLGIAVTLGLLWWNSQTQTEAQLRDQVGLMFYICIFWTSSSIFGAVYVFPFEKLYIVKERKADTYRLSAYYACSTLCDMVAHVTYPTLFMAIVYFMAGFRRSATCFVMTLLVTLLIAVTSQGAGELFGAASLSIRRAGMVASLMLMMFLLTGGYYVQHIPRFMGWLKYVSFLFYGFRLLLKVQYDGDRLYECQSPGGCRSLQSSPSFDSVQLDGGMKEAWVLIGMAVTYRFLAYVCLRKRLANCHV